jgi:hypothetical protein
MKVLQFLLVVLLAAFSYFTLPQAPARADHLRWMLPGYFPPPPSRRVHRYYPDVYEDDVYGDDYYDDDYDDEDYSYYEEPEPRYYQPKPRKKKSTASAPAKVKPKNVEKPKKKPQTANAPETTPKPKKATTPETTTASANVNCDKAKSIVTGYGFSNIQTMSCSGSVYSFSANRGGKSFSVKVSALNGELTEVKRQ